MNSGMFRLRLGVAATVGVMVGGLLTASSPTMAQPASGASSQPVTAETITVTAPRVARREVAGAGRFAGAPVEVLSISRPVSFAGLDLTSRAGVDEFKRRIMYGALAACDQMEAEYPSNIYVPTPAYQNCPDRTARAALQMADEVIAAAKSRPK